MANCLEDQFQPNETDENFRNHYKLVRRGVNEFRQTRIESSFESASANKVRKIINRPKAKKSPGYDGVTNSIIKQLPCHCIHHLTAIFNEAMELETGFGNVHL